MIRATSLVLLFLSLPATAENLTGKATLVDGDTIEIGEQVIHLHGIDAPEMDQFCTDKKSKRFNCGHAAMRRLFLYIGVDPLDCTLRAKRDDGSLEASCLAKSYFRRTENGATRGEKFDVGLEMVLTGHAFAAPKNAERYREAESLAKRKKKGFWAGTFAFPWEWQKRSSSVKKKRP